MNRLRVANSFLTVKSGPSNYECRNNQGDVVLMLCENDDLAFTKQVLHLSTWFVSVKHHLLDSNKTIGFNRHYMKYWNTKKCYLEIVSIIYVLVVLQRAKSLNSTLNGCTSPLQYFRLTVWTFCFTRRTVLTKYIMLARLQDNGTIMLLANYTFLWL